MSRAQEEARFLFLLQEAKEKSPPAFIATIAELVALSGNETDREWCTEFLSCYSREERAKAVEFLESLPADTERVKDVISKGISFINTYLLGGVCE